jgi:hypothetical protein
LNSSSSSKQQPPNQSINTVDQHLTYYFEKIRGRWEIVTFDYFSGGIFVVVML